MRFILKEGVKRENRYSSLVHWFMDAAAGNNDRCSLRFLLHNFLT